MTRQTDESCSLNPDWCNANVMNPRTHLIIKAKAKLEEAQARLQLAEELYLTIGRKDRQEFKKAVNFLSVGRFIKINDRF